MISESNQWTPLRIVVAIVWIASLSVWTWLLLDPSPVPPSLKPEPTMSYFLAKSLHVCGYGWCTLLGLWLLRKLPWRILFAGFMVWHGIATEIIQSYIPTRTGSEKDVGFDTLGISLACLVIWLYHNYYKRK
ncbi:MAG: VanZ family protein [Gemmataceae bacterium]